MFLNTSASPRLKRQLNLTLGDYILAPFHPENVFNTDVFPALPLLNPALYNFSNYQKIGAFFQRESVPFISWKVSPLAGLGLTAATSTVIVMANATLEEIYFRGGSLAKYGTIGSSALFGVNHLLNAFAVPNFSFENAGMQGLWAFFFGLYAANRTDANDGDFRRMIALHYWYNVSEIIFNYLISPETPVLFQITIPLTSF
jgi:CAAX amino terminal protease family.